MRSLIFISLCLFRFSLFAQQYTPKEFIDFEPAQYSGGERGLQMCLAEHIIYPEEALMNDIMGTVYIQFVIDTLGRVTDHKLDSISLIVYERNNRSAKKRMKKEGSVRVLNAEDNDYGLAEAAIAAVKQCENWQPAIQNGEKKKMRYKIPVKFQIF